MKAASFPALIAAAALAAPALATAAAAPGVNTVTVSVTAFAPPRSLPGLCRLDGQVVSVLHGEAYRPGQAISLSLPCARAQAELRNGYDVDEVGRAKFVAADVDARGRVVAPDALTDYGGFYSRDAFLMIDLAPQA